MPLLFNNIDGIEILTFTNCMIPSAVELTRIRRALENTEGLGGTRSDEINEATLAHKKTVAGGRRACTLIGKSYIYLMRNIRSGKTKIGLSVNVRFREKTLQSEEPEVEVLFSCEGTRRDEIKLHSIFSEQRVRGEWFSLEDNDIEYIRSLVWRNN
jgi:hypothetical protein